MADQYSGDKACMVLPQTTHAIALARDFTAAVLEAAGYRGARGDVLLAVSELVTNVLRHTYSAPSLTVLATPDGRRVRVEVADDSPVPPVERAGGPEGGYGLALISRLAVWGTVTHETGKVVWCEFESVAHDADRARTLPDLLRAPVSP
jgi:anti-sigma regulatory factor (Ser/Thr protein kinase)